MWDVEQSAMIRAWDCHKHAVVVTALKASAGVIVTASQDGAINIIDLASAQIRLRKDHAHSDIIRCIVETELGIMTVSNDETARQFSFDL